MRIEAGAIGIYTPAPASKTNRLPCFMGVNGRERQVPNPHKFALFNTARHHTGQKNGMSVSCQLYEKCRFLIFNIHHTNDMGVDNQEEKCCGL
jgi:hypothetical protein